MCSLFSRGDASNLLIVEDHGRGIFPWFGVFKIMHGSEGVIAKLKRG